MNEWLPVPAHRRAPLELIGRGLLQAERIILTTHVNADGDGAGCEAAVAAWLSRQGKTVHIVNPTPYPAAFAHLIENRAWVIDPNHPEAGAVTAQAQVVLVLDTGEPKRIGRVLGGLAGKNVLVIDHHPPSDASFRGTVLLDPDACATGELVFDLFLVATVPEPWPALSCQGLYTAIVTDTGSFRFSNTTPRAHALAGDLIRRGVDPEETYKRLFATMPLRRVQLLRAALDALEVDPDLPITWISIPRSIMVDAGASSEDLEGLVDQARAVEGTEVALLFRETTDGGTKVSLRSNGDVNVNAIARQFGGGGHVKASGAVLALPIDEARARVLAATRAALRDSQG
ncbi:MAG TPA: bifunctional oligoribonuclease/PAP phosphatase NrnA [Longimicrobiales bacterium]|nr:bifunctional oligoribonuclease/PAP phosphatase NrnA [Longimicrobiales bacterium]